MSNLSAVKAILDADATLLTTLTGGVWDMSEAGRLGLNRTKTPSAFDSSGNVKPSVLLKTLGPRPDGGVEDLSQRHATYRETIQVWIYQDDGYDDIATAADRIYTLLQGATLANAFTVRWSNEVRDARDDELDAYLWRVDYEVVALRT